MTDSETFIYYVVGVLAEVEKAKHKTGSIMFSIYEAQINAGIVKLIRLEILRIAQEDKHLKELLQKEGITDE